MILRQKTLLGETYIELFPSTRLERRCPTVGGSRPTRSSRR